MNRPTFALSHLKALGVDSSALRAAANSTATSAASCGVVSVPSTVTAKTPPATPTSVESLPDHAVDLGASGCEPDPSDPAATVSRIGDKKRLLVRGPRSLISLEVDTSCEGPSHSIATAI
jgi:hypothetical protein